MFDEGYDKIDLMYKYVRLLELTIYPSREIDHELSENCNLGERFQSSLSSISILFRRWGSFL